jgi:ubiquinone/menaquinone biosynthesis C-methylase UbiE
MTQPLDPVQFKASQREMWSSLAPGWMKWWRVFDEGARPLNEHLADLARVREGARVLDVATGIGEPALTAARRVGRKGSVLGVDLAPEMIRLARERAKLEGLVQAEFREMDAEKLELEPASFDAAVSRWGVMLLLDPIAALRGIHRALKPNARLAAAVWSVPSEVPFLSLPLEVLRREIGFEPPPAGTPGACALGKPGDLEALLERAGFRDLETSTIDVTFDFESAREYRDYISQQSGTVKRAMGEQPAGVRDRVWNAVERDASAHARPEGGVRFVNRVRCAGATRSSERM